MRREDQYPYSVFFADTVRHLNTVAGRLEWQASISNFPGWQLQAGVQGVWQRSNLDLFALRSTGPYLALSRVW